MINQEQAEKIEEYTEQGFMVSQIAKMMGINRQTVRRVRDGEHKFSSAKLKEREEQERQKELEPKQLPQAEGSIHSEEVSRCPQCGTLNMKESKEALCFACYLRNLTEPSHVKRNPYRRRT